jgi:protein KRI1
MAKPAKKSLLDESESDSDSSASSSSAAGLKVNSKYARAFEDRKRKEELTNASKQVYSDDSDSDDSSEDEDGDLLNPELDLKILKTINSIRSKDPSIYESGTKFFAEDALEGAGAKKAKGAKRMAYKDVIREQVLEDMDEMDGKKGGKEPDRKTLAYDDEQEDLRKAFVSGMDSDSDEDGDVLVKKSSAETDAEHAKYRDQLAQEYDKITTTKSEVSPLRDPKNEVGDADAFLKNFIVQRKWIDDDAATKFVSSGMGDYDDEEEELDRVDNFESKYNFRFEEGGSTEIISYARGGAAHADSMRRPDDKRKKEREARKEHKKIERQKKEEQLRHLKNLKREEIKNQLSKVKEVSGVEGMDESTLAKLLEGDFDPDQFSAAMASAYDNDYYEDEDEVDKADILGDEEGLTYDDDEGEEEEEEEAEEGDAPYEEEEDERVSQIKEIKSKADNLVDELYKLDYEDLIGDLPTRFKYRQVETNKYGLSTREILLAPDNELNKYVSLKKMAPYRDDEEWKVLGNKRRKFLKQCDDWEAEQEVQAAQEVEESGYEVEEGKSKKRKKKGKKGGESDAKEAEKETEAAMEDKIDAMIDEEENDTQPKKKTRKKAGKKKTKEEKAAEKAAEEAGEKKEEKKVAAIVEKKEEKAVEKKEKKVVEKKEKKSAKKAEKQSKIKGITQSRLAAYGM